jgi:hypothetical protein
MSEILQEVNFSEEVRIAVAFVDYHISSKHAFDPLVIIEGIGYQPSKCWSKGEHFVIKTIDPETKEKIETVKTYPHSLWKLRSSDHLKSKYVKEHFQFLISQLEPRKDWISQHLLNDSNYNVGFQVWIEPAVDASGFSLPSPLLSRASQLGNHIYFSIMCPLSYKDS